MDERDSLRDSLRDRLKAYFRMLAVHDPMRGNELVDVLDAYLDAKFKRAWVGLTDEEMRGFVDDFLSPEKSAREVFNAIETKLKEKNT